MVCLYYGSDLKGKEARMQNNKAIIVVLILLTLASVFVIQNKQGDFDGLQEHVFIPDLQEKVNDVIGVSISKNSHTITLNKQDGIWIIQESENFFADANKIATLLIELRNLKIKEKKTSNADNYNKLGLGENTTIIKLVNHDGQFADISLGNVAQRSQGIYVRKNNNKQTWLAAGNIDVNSKTTDWIVKTIIDVESNQVKSISYRPQNSTSFTVNKITPDDVQFVLENIPNGMQLKTDIDVNSFANALQNFDIVSAASRSGLDEDSKTIAIDFVLLSGMEFQLSLYQKDEVYLMEVDIENATRDTSFEQQLKNWQFVIPKFKYDALNKSLSSLIETIPSSINLEK